MNLSSLLTINYMASLTKKMTSQNFSEVIANFSPEEREKYQKLADTIDMSKPESIDKYGNEINDALSKSSDTIISKVSESAAGKVGEYVTQLTRVMQETKENTSASKFSKIPVLGKLVKTAQKIETKYNSIKKNVDIITEALKASKLDLQARNNELESQISANKKYLFDSRDLIIGAMMKLEEAKQARAEMNPDDYEAFELQRIDLTISQLEKKIGDFMANAYASGLNISEMQVIEDGNRKAIAVAESLVERTVPIWKATIASAIQIRELDKTVQAQEQLRVVTNNMLIENSIDVKNSMIKITELNEKPTFDPETLRTATDNIISMGEEIKRIQQDCAESRKQIRSQLEDMTSKMSSVLNLSDD